MRAERVSGTEGYDIAGLRVGGGVVAVSVGMSG